MTRTWHIHIKGIVQGVGFRPFVYRLAIEKKLKGWVNNTSDGVHIEFNAEKSIAEDFLKDILKNHPPLARITDYKLKPIGQKVFKDFQIVHSEKQDDVDLIISPDVTMCEDCKKELYDKENRRYHYPFITCTNCGPRYSIIQALPYDRPNTTMVKFKMCSVCEEEYNNPLERRYFSQTNSCPLCTVEMQLFENGKIQKKFKNLNYIVKAWENGKIVAIKGIGGYLLTCDATNEKAIATLRQRKRRPSKPFALMYHDIYILAEDTHMNIAEKLALESKESPIVILYIRDDMMTPLAMEQIAPGLHNIGVMMPYTPLFDLLLKKFGKPVVATSGNVTNEGIVYEDKVALNKLSKIADLILLNNRDIVIPQDDSVMRFGFLKQNPIIYRRSRGYAPIYINNDLKLPEKKILSTGAMLKSTFGILQRSNLYISQYLGNTDYFQPQQKYVHTYEHLKNLLKFEPEVVISDKHPGYFSTTFAQEIAVKNKIAHYSVQHHKAHFSAILGENNLFDSEDPVLGIIWDGTGYGDDGNIWGGEFFIYHHGKMKRIHHLDYYPFIVSDKMVREPRISLLCLSGNLNPDIIQDKFSNEEFRVYSVLKERKKLLTSSMGRLFDAVSSLVLGIDRQTYEGEAAIRLENAAYSYFKSNNFTLRYSYLSDNIPKPIGQFLLEAITKDIKKGFDRKFIAAKFHITLAHYIKLVAQKTGISKLAFSGGVFQNAWLTELLLHLLQDYELYFHRQLSPNDESISFGQILYHLFIEPKKIYK